MDDLEAARDIALGPFGEWGERGRIAVNVAAVYRELDPAVPCARRRRAVPAHGRPGALRRAMEVRLGIDIGGHGHQGRAGRRRHR